MLLGNTMNDHDAEKSETSGAVKPGLHSPVIEELHDTANTDRSQDAALGFLRSRAAGSYDFNLHANDDYARRLRRKVDMLVMPFLFVSYLMNFLDKVLLNYAEIMGMAPALKLRGNDYSNASSSFYIAAVVASVPNTYLLQRVPVGKYLGTCLVLWGICTSCTAAVHSYGGLVTVRVLCGIVESGIPSALMLISSQYYDRAEQAVRFSYWYCGIGIAEILGGLLSWAFQHVHNLPTDTDAGWRMLFVAIGCFTVLFGFLTLLLVPDTPMKAWFFNDEQKINLLEHVKFNQSGLQNTHFQPKQILETLIEPTFYMAFAESCFMGLCAGSVTTYSATLLRTFGYTPQHSALLNMPTGATTFVSVITCGVLVRYYGRRWLVSIVATCFGIIGTCLLSFYPHHNASASLAGLWIFQVAAGALPIFWQWILTNTAGHTKRAFMAVFLSAGFNLGNLLSPQTFQKADAPEYMPAKITLVVCMCSIVALTLGFFGCYSYWNRRKDSRHGPADPDVSETKAFSGLTDKENSDFRYKT